MDTRRAIGFEVFRGIVLAAFLCPLSSGWLRAAEAEPTQGGMGEEAVEPPPDPLRLGKTGWEVLPPEGFDAEGAELEKDQVWGRITWSRRLGEPLEDGGGEAEILLRFFPKEWGGQDGYKLPWCQGRTALEQGMFEGAPFYQYQCAGHDGYQLELKGYRILLKFSYFGSEDIREMFSPLFWAVRDSLLPVGKRKGQ